MDYNDSSYEWNYPKRRRRWVGTCGEDIIPLFGVENCSNQKRVRERRAVDLCGRLFAEQRNNQKIAGVSGGGSDGGEIRPGRNVWGLVVNIAGALFYGTVTFPKKLVSNFFVPLSTNYLSYLSSVH